MSQASAEITAMENALDQLEADMLAASRDQQVFVKLEAKRTAMQRELERLRFAERREVVEAEQAHVVALHDRLAEAVDRAAACRTEGEALDREIRDTLAALGGLVARGRTLTREHRAMAAQADNAATALRRAGEAPQRAGVGDWACPGQAAALACWQTAHDVLEASGLRPEGAAAVSAVQTRRS